MLPANDFDFQRHWQKQNGGDVIGNWLKKPLVSGLTVYVDRSNGSPKCNVITIYGGGS